MRTQIQESTDSSSTLVLSSKLRSNKIGFIPVLLWRGSLPHSFEFAAVVVDSFLCEQSV